MEHESKVTVLQPDSVMGVLGLFSPTVEGINKFAYLVCQEVEEGRVEPLDVALFMKTLEKIKEIVNEKLREHYVKAAELYGQKIFSYKGAGMTVRHNGGKYDYSVCGHTSWDDLNKIKIENDRQMDEIEKLLGALTKSTDFIVEGEGITCRPPVKKGGKMGIVITIE